MCVCVCVRFGRCGSVTFRWAQPGVKRHSVRPPCYRVHLSVLRSCICVYVCACMRARSIYLLWVYVLSACTWLSTNKLLQTPQYRPQSPGAFTEKLRYWHTWTHTSMRARPNIKSGKWSKKKTRNIFIMSLSKGSEHFFFWFFTYTYSKRHFLIKEQVDFNISFRLSCFFTNPHTETRLQMAWFYFCLFHAPSTLWRLQPPSLLLFSFPLNTANTNCR